MDDLGEDFGAGALGWSLLRILMLTTDADDSWPVVDGGEGFWTFEVRVWLGTLLGSELANGTSLASMHPVKNVSRKMYKL